MMLFLTFVAIVLLVWMGGVIIFSAASKSSCPAGNFIISGIAIAFLILHYTGQI